MIPIPKLNMEKELNRQIKKDRSYLYAGLPEDKEELLRAIENAEWFLFKRPLNYVRAREGFVEKTQEQVLQEAKTHIRVGPYRPNWLKRR